MWYMLNNTSHRLCQPWRLNTTCRILEIRGSLTQRAIWAQVQWNSRIRLVPWFLLISLSTFVNMPLLLDHLWLIPDYSWFSRVVIQVYLTAKGYTLSQLVRRILLGKKYVEANLSLFFSFSFLRIALLSHWNFDVKCSLCWTVLWCLLLSF